MPRTALFIVIASSFCSLVEPCRGQPSDSTEIGFTAAAGLEFELVADASLVRWPVVADWDSQGRLVVVESGGVGWPIQEHNRQLQHNVVRLVDDDGDGVFDRRLLAADKLPFTEGVLCLGNSLLVAAPPHIWKLTDKDNDGYCEDRQVWFDGQTITNCANDLHGPYLGRDGWIYWCKGAFGEQTHNLLNGSTQTDRAAHIFRRRIDGGPIDIVISGGMDNPVEVATTPFGERFFTSTFLQHPADGKRDGLGHAVYGSVFGKPHEVIEGLPRTGPIMPIMTHLGPAAPSGLIWLPMTHPVLADFSHLPDTHEGALISAQFNLHKASAHVLVPSASGSFTTLNYDLFRTERVDFHPTDVIADQDSLLVIDTGGWYDLCCPTSRVDQKVAEGGIYRLRSSTPKRSNVAPSSSQADTAAKKDSLEKLNDPRPWVQRSGLLQLRLEGDDAVAGLQRQMKSQDVALNERLTALWALSFIGTEHALIEVADLLKQPDLTKTSNVGLCRAACQILATHRYRPAKDELEQLLGSQAPIHFKRVVASTLGRVGDSNSIDGLMQAIGQQPVAQMLEHAILFALLDINKPARVVPYLYPERNTSVRRAALIALEQSSPDLLDPRVVFGAWQVSDTRLRQTALETLVRHPEWADDLNEPLSDALTVHSASGQVDDNILPLVRAWRDQPTVQELVAAQFERILDAAKPRNANLLASLVSVWKGTDAPPALVPAFTEWLAAEPGKAAWALSAVDLQADHCQPVVAAVCEEIAATADLIQLGQLAELLPAGQPFPSQTLFEDWIENRQYSKIAAFVLTTEQAEQVLAELGEVNALELPHVVSAVASARNETIDRELLRRLESLALARTLDGNVLPNLFRNRKPDVRQLAEQINEQLQATPQDLKQALLSTLLELPPGDPVRGLQVFRGTRAACSACHRMGYIGGRIGPELTRIGKTRTREALLEAILFPNARIEQSYRPTKILTLDGDVHNGLVVDSNEHMIELRVAADKTVKVERDNIDVEQPGTVSIMPSGMLELLSLRELADLMALLESAR